MHNKRDWAEYVKALRGRQDELRAETRPSEEGRISIDWPPADWRREALTAGRLAAIDDGIANLEKTIRRVISEQGLP